MIAYGNSKLLVGVSVRYYISGAQKKGIYINKKNGNLIILYALPYLIEIYSQDLSLLKRFGRKTSSFNTYSKDQFGNILSNRSSYRVTSLSDEKT